MKNAIKRIKGRVNITDSGCWEWSLKIRPNGYARMSFMGNSWYAHRLSYIAFKGEIPSGYDVCHSCDNRRCVNPDHLFVGTRKDNMQDAVSKGRQAKGEALPQSKITDEQRLEIVELAKSGLMYKEIAAMYGIGKQAVGQIAIKNGIRRR